MDKSGCQIQFTSFHSVQWKSTFFSCTTVQILYYFYPLIQSHFLKFINKPHHEKTCLWWFASAQLQKKKQQECWNLVYKHRYYTILPAKTYAGQSVLRCRLVCISVVHKWHKQVLSWCGSIVLLHKWIASSFRSEPISYTRNNCSGSTVFLCYVMLML